MNEQSWIAPQKPNRRSPRVGFSGGRGFRRHLLSRYSVRAEVRDGEDRGLRRCGFSQERLQKTADIWLRQEKRTKAAENPRRREEKWTVTDVVSSSPQSRSETPVIMWI